MLFNLQKPARSLTKELVNAAKKNRRCMSAAALPNPITSPDIQVLNIEMVLGAHERHMSMSSKLQDPLDDNKDTDFIIR